ncbi:MAG: PKD domain-containing protein [Vicinamibacterales bacterium]
MSSTMVPMCGLLLLGLLSVACDEENRLPTTPTPTTPSVPVSPPAPVNRAPTIDRVDVSPQGVALVGATVITFTATAADPDADTLAYDWNFGDGSSVTNAGPTPQHVFRDAGTLAVAVTVRDQHGESSVLHTPVKTVTVTGTWRGCALSGTGIQTYEISQNGATVSGTYKVPTLQVPFSGTLIDPRWVLIRIFDDQYQPWGLDPTGNTLIWTWYCALTRQ